MKPTITISGWVTRDSDGYIKFHSEKPYPVDTVETNHNPSNPRVIEERVWASGGKRFLIAQDEECETFPATLIEVPQTATIELWMETI